MQLAVSKPTSHGLTDSEIIEVTDALLLQPQYVENFFLRSARNHREALREVAPI